MAIPRRWEWGPPGTLAAPLASSPASAIVKHRTAGVVTTEAVALSGGAGTFGAHGTVAWDGDTLTVGTTGDIEVLALAAYDTAPDATEIARIAAIPHAWTWADLAPQLGSVGYTARPAPISVGYQPVASPIAVGYTARPAPIAVGYTPRLPAED